MTEKVKVTREQAEAIKVIHEQIVNTELGKLTTQEIAKGIVGMYEVEPEFKVGDWVVTKVTNHIGKITGFSNITNYYDIEGIQTDNIRHATPSEIAEEKERRWWRKHGRDVWELKKGDLLFCNHGGRVHRVMQPNLNKPAQDETRLSDGLWVTDDELKRNWKVACFIKDRLDVKTND